MYFNNEAYIYTYVGVVRAIDSIGGRNNTDKPTPLYINMSAHI